MDLRPHIERLSKRLSEVESALSDPKTFENRQRFQDLSREYAHLKEVAQTGRLYLKTLADLEENRALLKSEREGSEMWVMAQEEVARLEKEEARLLREVQRSLFPPD